MKKSFYDYLNSKQCLYGMIGQFYETRIPIEQAKELGINTDNIAFTYFGKTSVCSHNYTSEGLLAWDYLELEKAFIGYDELFDLRTKLKEEKINPNIDYYEKYLKNCILLLDMTKKYFSTTITREEAEKNKVSFDEEYDELDDQIDVCYHIFESAGERTWLFFGFENPLIAKSTIDDKRNEYAEKLFIYKNNKGKRLIRKVE